MSVNMFLDQQPFIQKREKLLIFKDFFDLNYSHLVDQLLRI